MKFSLTKALLFIIFIFWPCSCSSLKLVEKIWLCLVFSTHFSVFGYVMKHSSLYLIYCIKLCWAYGPLVSLAAFFWMSRNIRPKEEKFLLGERCVTSKKRLRGRLMVLHQDQLLRFSYMKSLLTLKSATTTLNFVIFFFHSATFKRTWMVGGNTKWEDGPYSRKLCWTNDIAALQTIRELGYFNCLFIMKFLFIRNLLSYDSCQ